MAHPKHRISKQRRNKRRTHDKATVPAIATVSYTHLGNTTCARLGSLSEVERSQFVLFFYGLPAYGWSCRSDWVYPACYDL